MSICTQLAKTLGGKWSYVGMCTWVCDDGKRRVNRCSVLGGFNGDEHVGSQMWLYGDGVPRRAEQYACKQISGGSWLSLKTNPST